MSGVAIIAELLLADDALMALVSAASVKEDLLPYGVVLPALLLRTESSSDYQTLKPGSFVRSNERISVTVRAESVRQRKAVLDRVREVCANRVGAFAECQRVSVLTAGQGPGLIGPSDTFERTQDFRVSFDRPA